MHICIETDRAPPMRRWQADAVMGIVRALCEDGRCIVQGQDDEEEGDRVEGANYSLAEERAKVVYCGDLNSTPETAVIEYLEVPLYLSP